MDVQAAIDRAPDGGELELPRGTFTANLTVEKSLTLRGAGPDKTVIDGQASGPCMLVKARPAKVRLIGLSLVNGAADAGGCVSFRDGALLELEDCLLEAGSARLHGGGGALLAGKSARFLRVRVSGCSAQQGGGVLVDRECEAELVASVLHGNKAALGGGLRIKEGARVRLVHCTAAHDGGKPGAGELSIDGTMTRTPRLSIVNSIVAPEGEEPAITSAGKFKGEVTVRHSLLPESARGKWQGEGVVYGRPVFLPTGKHRFALAVRSPGAKHADASATPEALVDLLGRPLLSKGGAAMGAYAAG